MRSILIVSKRDEQETFLNKLIRHYQIHPLDVTVVTREKAIGIEDVRVMKRTAFFKPIRGDAKAIIVKDAHTATIAAQNAMLKVLEEPPATTLIILSATKKGFLLPTIVSRCDVIDHTRYGSEYSREGTNHRMSLSSLQSFAEGERLRLAQEVAVDKDVALTWLEQMILAARQELLAHPSRPHLLTSLRAFQKMHTSIETTNVSPRFALENLLLNL